MSDIWKKWTINCALGEIVGIGCAGVIAFATNSLFGEPHTLGLKIIVLIAMMFAGFIEGTILGYFQWKVLVTKFKNLPKREWLYYTILVAVIGWLLGMLPSLFIVPSMVETDSTQSEYNFSNPILFAFLSILAGLILGSIFGLFQWFSLRKHAKKAYKWILANALGWGLGLGWIYLFASIPNENSSALFIILVGVSGGVLAGLCVGAITGIYLIKLEIKN